MIKICCTSHPDFPTRSTLLCKDSTVRIVACATGDVLTSLVCDLNFKPTSCAYAIGEGTARVTSSFDALSSTSSFSPPRCSLRQQWQNIDQSRYLTESMQNPWTIRKHWMFVSQKTFLHSFTSRWMFSDSINCLLIYEYVAQNTLGETPMLKSLVTRPSSDLIHIALKGFSRTLLIAGLDNGYVAVLRWNTGEIDFSLDVGRNRRHSKSREVLTLSLDAFISTCGGYDRSSECRSNHHLWRW